MIETRTLTFLRQSLFGLRVHNAVTISSSTFFMLRQCVVQLPCYGEDSTDMHCDKVPWCVGGQKTCVCIWVWPASESGPSPGSESGLDIELEPGSKF